MTGASGKSRPAAGKAQPHDTPVSGSRPSRSQATRHALMRAAEKLVAERGIENVSLREIVTTAGQKNESALQYHFGSLQGLIAALHASRDAQLQARREALLQDLLARHPQPSLPQICRIMVQPAFELARSRADFRRYVKAFGHEITLTDEHAIRPAPGIRRIGPTEPRRPTPEGHISPRVAPVGDESSVPVHPS